MSLIALVASVVPRAYKISPTLVRRVLRLLQKKPRREGQYRFDLVSRYLHEVLRCCVCGKDFVRTEAEKGAPLLVFAAHADELEVAHATCYCQNGQLPLRLKDPRLTPLFHDLAERYPRWQSQARKLRLHQPQQPKRKLRKKEIFRRHPAELLPQSRKRSHYRQTAYA